MFNFTLIEKYKNIWQTDKPRVNSFTGYHSWNIKTWLFTSYAKLRERDTQISSHLSSSAYVVMYTEYIHYPHWFYTNQIQIKISQLTDFLCWFYFFKYCISSLIRYVLPLHLLFTCIYERGGWGRLCLLYKPIERGMPNLHLIFIDFRERMRHLHFADSFKHDENHYSLKIYRIYLS